MGKFFNMCVLKDAICLHLNSSKALLTNLISDPPKMRTIKSVEI